MKPPAPPFTTGEARKSSAGRGHFARVPHALVREAGPRLGATAIAVYVALASFTNGDGFCFPSLRKIAGLLGLTRHQVRHALQKLIAYGIVTVERMPNPSRRRPPTYRLLDPIHWRIPAPEKPELNGHAQSPGHDFSAMEIEKIPTTVGLCAQSKMEASETQAASELPSPHRSDVPDWKRENGQSEREAERAKTPLPSDPHRPWEPENLDGNGDFVSENSRASPEKKTQMKKTQGSKRGVAALLDRRSAPGDEVGKALLIANLVEELRELDVRDPEDLIKTALRHGWILGDLAEVVSCAAEYSIDGSLEELVGCSAPEWLADVIPRGPKAAWDVLRRLLERDLADPPAFPELAWMAGEPLGWRWWRWRLQGWLEVRRDEAAGDPRVERFLARPAEPPWEKEVRE